MNAYLVAAAGIVAAAAAILILAAVPPQDDPGYFEINAAYSDGTISISFRDHSDGTENVSMEILGMSETFRKTYESGHIEEHVPFLGPPKYGWGAHPIIFEVSHQTLGEFSIKTEIRDAGQPAAAVIFARP